MEEVVAFAATIRATTAAPVIVGVGDVSLATTTFPVLLLCSARFTHQVVIGNESHGVLEYVKQKHSKNERQRDTPRCEPLFHG